MIDLNQDLFECVFTNDMPFDEFQMLLHEYTQFQNEIDRANCKECIL